MHPDLFIFLSERRIGLTLVLFSILYNLHSIAQQPNSNAPIQIGEAAHMLSTFSGVEMGFRAGNLVAYIELAGLEEKKNQWTAEVFTCTTRIY